LYVVLFLFSKPKGWLSNSSSFRVDGVVMNEGRLDKNMLTAIISARVGDEQTG